MAERTLTDGTFDGLVVGPQGPAMVDVWAPWCGPCRSMTPVVEELAAEFDGRVLVGTLNTDENNRVPERFRVHAIPTLLFFARGVLVGRLVGVQTKAVVREMLDSLVSGRLDCPPLAG